MGLRLFGNLRAALVPGHASKRTDCSARYRSMLDKETDVCSLSIDRSTYLERFFLSGFLLESNAISTEGKRQHQEGEVEQE